MKLKYSVCLIVKNEAELIAQALQSIPAAFERIVVDTGSTDQTMEIVGHLNLPHTVTGEFAWDGDFADARNYAASLASGSYILALDADEALAPDAESVLDTFTRQYPGHGGSVTIRNHMEGEVAVHQAFRFYPRQPDFRFHGAVHETIYRGDSPAPFRPTGLVVEHYGYEPARYQARGKGEGYLEMYRKHLDTNPNDGYMWYQLGKLHYSLGNHAEAEKAFRRCLEIGETKQLYFPVMLVKYGYTLQRLGRSGLAERLLASFADTFKDYPDLFFFLGSVAMDTGNVKAIEPSFQRALEIGETVKYATDEGVGSYKSAYNLGLFYELLGRKDDALVCYRLAAESGFGQAIKRMDQLR